MEAPPAHGVPAQLQYHQHRSPILGNALGPHPPELLLIRRELLSEGAELSLGAVEQQLGGGHNPPGHDGEYLLGFGSQERLPRDALGLAPGREHGDAQEARLPDDRRVLRQCPGLPPRLAREVEGVGRADAVAQSGAGLEDEVHLGGPRGLLREVSEQAIVCQEHGAVLGHALERLHRQTRPRQARRQRHSACQGAYQQR
mmetsp:Transcript_126972/g.367542  ORF Transcript_126972/g.367542 Transcript_126972/m.367542 type:complete len:200 (+) Transcript_126972:799-1398(+)